MADADSRRHSRFHCRDQAAIDVEHGGITLVHVLGGETEHVIMKPMSAHGLMPIAWALCSARRLGWAAGHDVSSVRVKAEMSAQHDRPVIVVKLSGKK